jgi:class 3 adenylate cyclase
MTLQSVERDYTAGFVRWRGQIPWKALEDASHEPSTLLEQASSSPSIAVVGDIRKSQDLMTYAADADSFSEHIVSFIEKTRALIDEHCGIFDKFTGDGFLAYFNEDVCRSAGVNFIDSFIGFVREEGEFAASLFDEWGRTVRKLPPSPVGLAMGADVGVVQFRDLRDHLVAVGDTIVWASRMSSVGRAGEVIVNNRLFNALRDRPGCSFEDRTGETKAGETFLSRALAVNQTMSSEKQMFTRPSFALPDGEKPRGRLRKRQDEQGGSGSVVGNA